MYSHWTFALLPALQICWLFPDTQGWFHVHQQMLLQGADGQRCWEAAKWGQMGFWFSKRESEPQTLRFRGSYVICDFLFPWRAVFFPWYGRSVFVDGTTQSRRAPRSSVCIMHIQNNTEESKPRAITALLHTGKSQPSTLANCYSTSSCPSYKRGHTHTWKFIITIPTSYGAMQSLSLSICGSSTGYNHIWAQFC